MRDELGEIYCDPTLAELFLMRGRLADGLSDRQATDAVWRTHRLDICPGAGTHRSGVRLFRVEIPPKKWTVRKDKVHYFWR